MQGAKDPRHKQWSGESQVLLELDPTSKRLLRYDTTQKDFACKSACGFPQASLGVRMSTASAVPPPAQELLDSQQCGILLNDTRPIWCAYSNCILKLHTVKL